MSEYPKDRPQLFALHYVRWLIDAGVVNEIGPDAFALLVAVVMREDDLRYQRAPNFFNEQLMRGCGIGSEPALIRARKRAVDAELLDYRPGAKRRPGVYFVCGFANESLAKAEGIRRESAGNRLPSIPNPIPNPIDTARAEAFDALWAAWPKRNGLKKGKGEARKAFAKIKPGDYPDLMRAVERVARSGEYPQDLHRFIKGDWREWLDSAPSTPAPPPPPRMRSREELFQ